MKLKPLHRDCIPKEFTREILHWELVYSGQDIQVKGQLSEDPGSRILTTPLTNYYLGLVPNRRLWFKTENGSYYFIKCEFKTLKWWLEQFNRASK